MSNDRKKEQAARRAPQAKGRLDEATFKRLVDEGQALRRNFDADTAQMRMISADDLKIRSR